VGFVHRLRAESLGQRQAGHGDILSGVPEAVEDHDGFVTHLTLDRLRVDQVDDGPAAQQIHRTLNGRDLVGQTVMRRVDDFQQSAGQAGVLCDQPGDHTQIRVGHVLLHLQINHDLRLGRNADALQRLLDLLGSKLLGHKYTLKVRGRF
nr:hypothetical protein [Tanacetum cinerariifolium]